MINKNPENTKKLRTLFKVAMSFIFIVLIFAILSIYNKANQSTAVFDGQETRVEYTLTEQQIDASNAEPVIIQRETNEYRELRRLCSRERSGAINYESNYCEKFEALQNED